MKIFPSTNRSSFILNYISWLLLFWDFKINVDDIHNTYATWKLKVQY